MLVDAHVIADKFQGIGQIDLPQRQVQLRAQECLQSDVFRHRPEQQFRQRDVLVLALEVIERALQLDSDALEVRLPLAFLRCDELGPGEIQPAREVELALEGEGEQAAGVIEGQHADATVGGFVEFGDVALGRFRNIDHLQRNLGPLELCDLPLHDRILRRDRVHIVALPRRILVDRNVEHVHGGVVDVVIEQILDAPADRRLQFLARHIGRVHHQQLVFRGLQQRRAAIAAQFVLLRRMLQFRAVFFVPLDDAPTSRPWACPAPGGRYGPAVWRQYRY